MKINDLQRMPIFAENEQVAVFSEDMNIPHGLLYEGCLCNVPEELLDKEIWAVSAMSERRRERYNLNKYGWLEIWIEDEDYYKLGDLDQ